jgi:hypothetical protein
LYASGDGIGLPMRKPSYPLSSSTPNYAHGGALFLTGHSPVFAVPYLQHADNEWQADLVIWNLDCGGLTPL